MDIVFVDTDSVVGVDSDKNDESIINKLAIIWGYNPYIPDTETRRRKRIEAMLEDIDIYDPESILAGLIIFYDKALESAENWEEFRSAIKYLHFLLECMGYPEELVKSVIFE